MKISVVIPTLGRKHELILTLESILKQSRAADEIIVVDQNPRPFEEVLQFISKFQNIRHLHNLEVGLCRNYNTCWKNSKCEIVLYVDDDVQADPNLIEQHVRRYEEDSKVGCVSGRVLTPGPIPRVQTPVGKYQRFLGDVIANFSSETQVGEVDFAQGCNMSFLKKALDEVGGFDEGFTGNAYYFEPDACLRVKVKGYKVVFEPRAMLVHLQSPRGGARLHDKAQHTYFFIRNGLRLYRRHSPVLGLPIYVLKQLGYCLGKSLYNQNASILLKGTRGIRDGLTQLIDH